MASRAIIDLNNNDDLITVIKKCNTNFKLIISQSAKQGQIQMDDLNNTIMDINDEINNLAPVATSGDYDDLINTPTIPPGVVVDDHLDSDSTNAIQNGVVTDALGDKADSSSLATVATSGDFNDLINTPSGLTVDSQLDSNSTNPVENGVITDALDDKVSTTGDMMTGDLDMMNRNVRAVDLGPSFVRNSGNPISDIESNGYQIRDTNYNMVTKLGTRRKTDGTMQAFVRAYNDSSGVEVTEEFRVGIDRNGDAEYEVGTPSALRDALGLASVASSGDYSDLTNTPSLAAVATSGDYDDLINTPSLATVATSGDYDDLLNKPTIDNTIPSAYCNTSSGNPIKTAVCTGFVLRQYTYIQVIIANDNTYQNSIVLDINDTGAKTININGTASSSTNYTLPAGAYFVYYDGTYYRFRTDNRIPANIIGTSEKLRNARSLYTALNTAYDSNNPVTFDGSADKILPVSGTLPIANGGTGNTGVTSETTITNVATPGTNINITSVDYRKWGKVAMFNITFKPTAAISSGATVFTMVSGKRPVIVANGNDSSTTYACTVNTNGTVLCRRSLTSGTSYSFRAMYLLP